MHLRQLITSLVIGTALACVATLASAQQIYKWKDAKGVTHFSQTPPAVGKTYTKMNLEGQPAVSSNPPPASADTESEQPTTTEAANTPAPASTATQPDTASNRAKLCTQLNSNIKLLQGKQPVVTKGANGKQQVMSDNAREQQLATAQAQKAQYCAQH